VLRILFKKRIKEKLRSPHFEVVLVKKIILTEKYIKMALSQQKK
jgi:hypothetical protein